MKSTISISTTFAMIASANVAHFVLVNNAVCAKAKSQTQTKSQAQAQAPVRAAKLRRVDWLVTGSSCATCLIRLEKKLKTTSGVLKAAVSIYKPFNAAIVYDPSKTSWSEISKTLSGEKVGTAALQEISLDDVPLVLEPR